MRVTLDEEKTEFNPGSTKYFVEIHMKDKDPVGIVVSKEVYGNLSVPQATHPILAKLAIREVKDYLSLIYTQGDY